MPELQQINTPGNIDVTGSSPESDHWLQDAFWDVRGYKEFESETLPSIEDIWLREQLVSVLLKNKDNPELKKYIWWRRWTFPKDSISARMLQEAENATQEAENATQEQDAIWEINEYVKLLDSFNRMPDSSFLKGQLIALGIDFWWDKTIVWPQIVVAINENSELFLQNAQQESRGTFITTYNELKSFNSTPWVNISEVLWNFQAYYDESVHLIENPALTSWGLKEAQKILGDSDITDIQGDIFYGEEGEKLDIGKQPPELSLSGWGDFEIKIADVEWVDPSLETGIQRIEWQIEANKKRIIEIDTRISKLHELQSKLNSVSFSDFDKREDFIEENSPLMDSLRSIIMDVSPKKFLDAALKIITFDILDSNTQKQELEQINISLWSHLKAQRFKQELELAKIQKKLKERKERWKDGMRNISMLGLGQNWSKLMLMLNSTEIQWQIQRAIPGFDVRNIDIASWNFGQWVIDRWNIKVFRENLAMFANIVYHWDIEPLEGINLNRKQYTDMELSDVKEMTTEVEGLMISSGVMKWWVFNRNLVAYNFQKAASKKI